MVLNKMNPNSENAIEKTLQIMNDKGKLEKEIDDLYRVLESNNVGMNESLIDDDGFPRNDIDVYQVRHARHRIICLLNDHKLIMEKIAEGLNKSLPSRSNTSSTQNENNYCDIKLQDLEPFASVTLVSPNSPAQACGLEVNDMVLQFGSVNSSNFRNMQDIAAVVRYSQGSKINVVVKKKGRNSHITLELFPKTWSGDGLLGCKIDPVEAVER
uniref:26S proteasome non-ATPase regulatory subunit 9 n=2 Tax=Clastoptera arizonana TaxID=38151 RepID=A0A1B6CZX7_9HEMI